MAIIYVDYKKYEVSDSDNLLQSCLSLGLDIPYFCWHPALGSIGICRQCAVKQYSNTNDTRGKLVMSCMTPSLDGTLISIVDEEAKQFRQSVIEWLMINHPHDCPVCEEGGNCHLQDMTVMTGHNFRRYRFTKRTHYSQYLGPFISHEMNRCISCYRCIRYYKDYADGTDLGVYGARDNIYFGRTESGVLESEFSGNLVEICPTGVFTDKTHSKRYNRKWDMQFAPSICHQCSLGCNISPGERYGELRRIENRYNGSINHYFLCDLGRFGYGYVNLKDRPRQPMHRYKKDLVALSIKQIIKIISDTMCHSRKIIGIGSPRASIESNFALRELVGAENFYNGISDNEQGILTLILNILRNGNIRTPSLREMESYDAVLILGEDITETGARIALAVRQVVKGKAREIAIEQNIADWHMSAIMNIGQNSKHPLFITNIDKTRLDDVATWSYYAPVVDQARLGFAIAQKLDNKAPKVDNIDAKLKNKIDLIAQSLANARKPLIISGSHAGSKAIITAAANVAFALKKQGKEVGISFVVSSVNSIGLAMMSNNSIDNALNIMEYDVVDNLIVLENDIYRHASIIRIDAALNKISNLIVLDHQRTKLQEKANFILPVTSFAESSGTVINHEGRAQRFFKVYNPSYYNNQIIMLDSWRWLHYLQSSLLNRQVIWTQLDHVIDAVTNSLPQLSEIKNAAPNSSFRVHGQKLAREPNRYSGRTATRANINVHEPRVSQDHDTMFTFSMEGNSHLKMPYQQIAFAWAPGWNSAQAWNKFQDKVGGHLRYGDPGIRLLEINANHKLEYFSNIPSTFVPAEDGSWLIAPYWHLFGSEETSQRAPVIQERMQMPYIMMNHIDATKLDINNGTMLTIRCMGIELYLPARLSYYLHTGQIGLPLGFPGIPPILAGKYIKNIWKAKL